MCIKLFYNLEAFISARKHANNYLSAYQAILHTVLSSADFCFSKNQIYRNTTRVSTRWIYIRPGVLIWRHALLSSFLALFSRCRFRYYVFSPAFFSSFSAGLFRFPPVVISFFCLASIRSEKNVKAQISHNMIGLSFK